MHFSPTSHHLNLTSTINLEQCEVLLYFNRVSYPTLKIIFGPISCIVKHHVELESGYSNAVFKGVIVWLDDVSQNESVFDVDSTINVIWVNWSFLSIDETVSPIVQLYRE